MSKKSTSRSLQIVFAKEMESLPMQPVIIDTDVSLLSHRFDCLSIHTEYMHEFWFSWRDWTFIFFFLPVQFVFLFSTNVNIWICIIMLFFCLSEICAYFLPMLDISICVITIIINVRAQRSATSYDVWLKDFYSCSQRAASHQQQMAPQGE